MRASPPNETQLVTSVDGTTIAYDVTGAGPVVILLHGGGQDRRVWHERGYVDRLSDEFTVVTIDIRGNGESEKPEAVAAYDSSKFGEDILAVADAINADRFVIWGFSYGANVGRYLALRSSRVIAMLYIGISFGPAVDEMLLSYVQGMRNRPAFITAMLDYLPVEPSEMSCPTLWLLGSKNDAAMQSFRKYEHHLNGTAVTVAVIDGINHPQELEEIDRVFDVELRFTRMYAPR